jgi:peroxiredoxin
MAVNRRVLGISITAALAVSVVGGYALSRRDDTTTAPDDVVLDTPGIEQIPAISANANVEGVLLPTVDLVDNDGAVISTADLIGQPLIINYWFSTCAPCKRELPDFASVHADLGDRIRFVGVNPVDTAEVNGSFAHDRGVRYELLRDPDGAFTDAVGIANAPVTLFIAADGTIVRQTASLDAATLRADALELLP